MHQKIINLLHFYQPYNQQEDVLERIVNECYRPLINGLLERPNKKAVINFPGVLTNLLDKYGYTDIIEGVSKLVDAEVVEFVDSAMYHTIMPLLPKDEVIRQISLNREVNTKFFGKKYSPIGFFCPELAVDPKTIKLLDKEGYKWVPAAQVAYPNPPVQEDKLYKQNGTDMFLFFRNKRVSILMLSAITHNAADFIKETTDIHSDKTHWFTVMDAETYGHHRIGHEDFFFEVLDDPFFDHTTIRDVLKAECEVETVDIRPSTWTNKEQDFWVERASKSDEKPNYSKSFMLWKDPENIVHKMQWDLTEYVIGLVNNYKDKDSKEWKTARAHLDYAIASDQYWWASANPWWSVEMIETGAHELLGVAKDLNVSKKEFKYADDLYREILDQVFDWQRTGYIRKRYIENADTMKMASLKDRTPSEWFNQLMIEFEDEMNASASRQEYEKAIKWRDALIKIKKGNDRTDFYHVVNELWTARNIPSLKPFLEHNWDEFSDFIKPFFKDVSTVDDFLNMKQSKENNQN